MVYAYEGEDIPDEHGGPVRLFIPHLYFWKSAKWLRGLELRAGDEPGFWRRTAITTTAIPSANRGSGATDPGR